MTNAQTVICVLGCPIGIDVSHEINTYKKVINSNCTSCMICIDDCPEKALKYKFRNPVKDYDQLSFSDFTYQKASYINEKIKSKFISLRDKDILIIPFCLLFGLLF